MIRFYHACNCGAKWFCPYEFYVCPRCGLHSISTEEREPPWLAHSLKEDEMAKKKILPTVQLSDSKCLLCPKSGVILKSEEHEFSAPLCTDHMIAVLKNWKKPEEPAPTEKKENGAQVVGSR